jgi:hypothetical protein
MNEALRAAVLAMRDRDPVWRGRGGLIGPSGGAAQGRATQGRATPSGEVTNNRGGWQSYWRSRHPRALYSFREMCRVRRDAVSVEGCWAWRALKAHVLDHVRMYLARETSLSEISGRCDQGRGTHQIGDADVGVSVHEWWVMINGRGDWNARHAHATATLAGCYYVAGAGDVPNLLDAARDYGPPGVRPGHGGAGLGPRNPGARRGWGLKSRRYVPRPVPRSGETFSLTLFPGFVDHETPANDGDALRIAVCFNIMLTAAKDRVRRPRDRGWWRPEFSDRDSFLAPLAP